MYVVRFAEKHEIEIELVQRFSCTLCCRSSFASFDVHALSVSEIEDLEPASAPVLARQENQLDDTSGIQKSFKFLRYFPSVAGRVRSIVTKLCF